MKTYVFLFIYLTPDGREVEEVEVQASHYEQAAHQSLALAASDQYQLPHEIRFSHEAPTITLMA